MPGFDGYFLCVEPEEAGLGYNPRLYEALNPSVK